MTKYKVSYCVGGKLQPAKIFSTEKSADRFVEYLAIRGHYDSEVLEISE